MLNSTASPFKRQARFAINTQDLQLEVFEGQQWSDSSGESPTTKLPRRFSKAAGLLRPTKSKMVLDSDKQREQTNKAREEKAKALEGFKQSIGYRILRAIKSKEPRSVPVDESKADTRIDYGQFIHRKVGYEWRAGRTVQGVSGELEYRSAWLDMIGKLLFAPSLEAADVQPQYFAALGITGDQALLDDDEEAYDELLQRYEWPRDMASRISVDLSIDHCLLPLSDPITANDLADLLDEHGLHYPSF